MWKQEAYKVLFFADYISPFWLYTKPRDSPVIVARQIIETETATIFGDEVTTMKIFDLLNQLRMDMIIVRMTGIWIRFLLDLLFGFGSSVDCKEIKALSILDNKKVAQIKYSSRTKN